MAENRYGPFWDMIEGRAPLPRSSALLGFRLIRVVPEEGILESEFRAASEFMNAGGFLQGGIITAMLDDAMSFAGTAALGGGSMLPTLEMKTSFVRGVTEGLVIGIGRVVHRGRDFVFLQGELKGEGRLLATASATARILQMSPRDKGA
ncbi:PaaI family thioesterase [Tardiphaga alba]|uniref:PaaI family thioesterase n=1 Tax=Tardiphaga alba TaxID=340268 RepID=A0ABX8AI29_9BRAD|nr:PaaI family thioesterase [Tardiphaga alba]QUS41985.1 PaaI family thioesterase [Tardiphaga alba]